MAWLSHYCKKVNEIGAKLVSKKLNGAEVLQLILDGKVKFGDKFKRIDRDCIYVYKEKSQKILQNQNS